MQTKQLLENAVINSTSSSSKGVLDKLFTVWFDRLVYPQIWEDPVIDARALNINENSRIMTIASGSCNIFNYLTLNPKSVTAVDLNGAHIALFHLKKTALQKLPNYDAFFDFFGHANKRKNVENYVLYIKPYLDAKTIEYWEGKDRFKRRKRIDYFEKGFYKFGLLGEFIGFTHKVTKLLGCDPKKLMKAKNIQEQKEIFEKHLAPVFKKKFVKMALNNPITLYSLGIPPSQFEKMKNENASMSALVKERMRKLACDFDLKDNYFAWQAFGREYDVENKIAIPDYLKEKYYKDLKSNMDKISINHISMTDYLAKQNEKSFDSFILLDAQDWMDDDALNALWEQITRTADDNARVIFRTAGEDDILKGRLKPEIISNWSYDKELNIELTPLDRAAIYGGFHTYVKQ